MITQVTIRKNLVSKNRYHPLTKVFAHADTGYNSPIIFDPFVTAIVNTKLIHSEQKAHPSLRDKAKEFN